MSNPSAPLDAPTSPPVLSPGAKMVRPEAPRPPVGRPVPVTTSSKSRPAVEIRPVRHHELQAALRLALSSGGRPADDAALSQFLQFALARRLDVSALQVAAIGRRLAFAVMPVPSPGRTCLLLCPPQLGTGLSEEHAAEVFRAICRDQADDGRRLVQALIPPGSTEVQRGLTGAGFFRLAELVYLQHGVRGMPRPRDLALPAGLSLRTWTPATAPLFRSAILRSYEQSLDCPGLAGRRSIDEVIEGHMAAGEFREAWWQVLVENTPQGPRPLGVLLLAGIGEDTAAGLELVYLGLVPEARGRGLGRTLLTHADAAAWNTVGRSVTLAVDGCNVPALHRYQSHGYRRLQMRTAMLRDLAETPV